MKTPLIESVYLTGEIPAAPRALRRVLVLGGDSVGANLARRLSCEGFDVTLVGAPADCSNGRVSVMPDALLEEVRGFGSGFHVSFRNPSSRVTDRFGFIIAAGPAQLIPKFGEYNLTPSERIVSLTELEAKLRSEELCGMRKSDYFHAAFLCGLEGGSDPSVLKRVLDVIDVLHESDRVQCYVFTRNLKVAGAGLERRYRDCREKGTLFFKFDGNGPAFETDAAGVVVAFKDPLLGLELELRPDMLVVDEYTLPPASLEPLMAAIPSAPAFSPFLQPESTRFCGVETPKCGILAVGPSRGVFSPELIEADVEAAVSAVKKSVPSRADFPGPPEVDPDRCTMCLTCVRMCPHGAMGFHRHAAADPDSCVRCGICAAECPMAAIRLEQNPEKDIPGLITDGLAAADDSSSIIAFLCSRSAAQALDAAWATVPDNLTPVVVPCAGTVSVEHILSALQQGAGGVLAAGCFKGNCASVYGSSLAEQRTVQVSLILKEIGIDPARVMFAPVAANTPWALRKAVQALEKAMRV